MKQAPIFAEPLNFEKNIAIFRPQACVAFLAQRQR